MIQKRDDGTSPTAEQLERYYVFAVMWSVGALLELDDRAKLETFMRENTKLKMPPVAAGSGDTIFEYSVSANGEYWFGLGN